MLNIQIIMFRVKMLGVPQGSTLGPKFNVIYVSPCFGARWVRLEVGDVKVEGGEGVALGADGAGLVLAAVVGAGLGDLNTIPRRAFHGESVPGRCLVDRLAVLQPLKLEWWLLIQNISC